MYEPSENGGFDDLQTQTRELYSLQTMHSPDAGAVPEKDARDWSRILAPYREASDRRGIIELLITLAPFLALWTLMAVLIQYDQYLFAMPLIVPAAFMLVRLFMIQHDCGHGSFFRGRRANDRTGRILGVLTMTPYSWWRRAHAIHHAGCGNLEKRGIGDVDTLTVDEYRARSFWGRLRYRLYRHPFILFGLGPAYLFFLQHRLPIGMLQSGWSGWVSAMGTNAMIVLAGLTVVLLLGFEALLFVHFPIVALAASVGVWLFYVQHQFEHTLWDHDEQWDWHNAALHGSSHYDLPGPLRWLTANIGMHHIHHLCSRIPYYRLPQVLRNHPELRDVGRLTLAKSFGCVRLVLWDENQRRLITFNQAMQTA